MTEFHYWVIDSCKGKGWKRQLLKCSFIETLYGTWKHRNQTCFDSDTSSHIVCTQIIDSIVYRKSTKPRLRPRIRRLLMP